jgi:hypothetical protein
MQYGGRGGNIPKSEETKKKISEALKGNKNSLGYKHTEEQNKKQSERQKGKPNGLLGYKEMPEHKKHISESKMGKKRKPFSEEWKKNMSEAHKNRPPESKETKKKIANSNSKTYQITYPNGETKIIKNLTQFCRDNNLYQGNMVCVSQGKRKHHKGFKCSKVALQ